MYLSLSLYIYIYIYIYISIYIYIYIYLYMFLLDGRVGCRALRAQPKRGYFLEGLTHESRAAGATSPG
jgi:hypothetical protein